MAILNVLFTVAAWLAMFAFVPLRRIKAFVPIGILASLLLFVSEYITIILGLVHYATAIVFFAGMPIFHPIYAFALGILIIHFMKEEWVKKLPVIFLFAIINTLLTYVLRRQGIVVFQGTYNMLIDFIATFMVFSFGVWVSEGLWRDRIYGTSKSVGFL